MRPRRVYSTAALGLCLVLAVPTVAMAQGVGTQHIDAQFSPSKLDDKKFSNKGTLFTRVFLTNLGSEPPTAATATIDYDRDIKFKDKGVKRCDPAAIIGQTTQAAIAACRKARVGQGSASALGIATPGVVTAFNGPKQSGNPTILLHSVTATLPLVLTGELQNSPLPQFGKRLVVPVAQSAGGPVPDAITITDFDTTVKKKSKLKSKAKRAKRLKKKAKKASGKKAKRLRKKAKRVKKKAKVSYVSARCKDGTFEYQATFTYTNAAPQVVRDQQACSPKR